ncbi:MAG: IS21 family transposase [Nitrospirota bacterium]
MIGPERESAILRLHHAEKWPIGTIAKQLGLHHSTVRRVLAQAGVAAGPSMARPSIVDPFVPFIVETLTKYPRLRASRLHAMVRERGYEGSQDYFRHVVSRYRPRPAAEAYQRLRTLPGEQGQVDWAHFGKLTIGNASRTLWAFVMVLAYSRKLFLRFYFGSAMPAFLHGHVSAFTYFGGVPRELLYDNLKSAVLERLGDAIRFNPTLLDLSAHYRFLPKPVAPARGNEKGRVERAIRFVRDSFFAARAFTDIDDLNRQARLWCDRDASDRPCPGDRKRSVRDVFAEEQARLIALPADEYPTDERVEVEVGKTPYARFDLNDYSVPHVFTQRTLTIVASLDTVRILDGQKVVASHTRSWDRAQQLENPDHVRALEQFKRKGREHRTLDRLHHLAPHSQKLLQIVAERGGNIGSYTRRLTVLLERFSANELDAAIATALDRDTPHVGAVRQLLDKARADRNEPPPVRLPLPDDPRLDRLVVRPHSLASYDTLRKDTTRDDNHND